MTAVTIPTSFEAMTPEWLTTALRQGGAIGDATVTSVTFEPVGQGVGILCQLARLTLTYDGAAEGSPRTLIAKIPTTDPQTRGMVSIFRFYEREVRFYQELAAELTLGTARCYFGDFDAGSGGFILLLEDLAATRLGDQLAGASIEDARTTIGELAKLHAAWWNSPRLASLTWMPVANDPINKAGVMLFPQAWQIFLQRFGDGLPGELRTTGEKLCGEVGGILDQFVDAPITLCHGDVRLDNLFFAVRTGDPPLKVIDWQIGIRGVGAYDAGYFMSQSLNVDTRRAHEEELLRLYHSLLTENGVSGYSYDELLHHYRWTLLFCMAYPVMGGGLGDLANERGYQLVRAMRDRSAAAIADWKAWELLG